MINCIFGQAQAQGRLLLWLYQALSGSLRLSQALSGSLRFSQALTLWLSLSPGANTKFGLPPHWSDIFWQFLTSFWHFCQFLTFLKFIDIFWQLLTFFDIFWHFLTVVDSCWQLLTVSDSFWKFWTVFNRFSVSHVRSSHCLVKFFRAWLLTKTTCCTFIFSHKIQALGRKKRNCFKLGGRGGGWPRFEQKFLWWFRPCLKINLKNWETESKSLFEKISIFFLNSSFSCITMWYFLEIEATVICAFDCQTSYIMLNCTDNQITRNSTKNV